MRLGITTCLIALIFASASVSADSSDSLNIRFYYDDTLVSVTRPLPPDVAPPVASVEALVAGPTQAEFEQGIISAIPYGTTVVSNELTDDSITVDLSEEVLQGLDEHALKEIFQQFSVTLGDFPEILSIALTCKGDLLSSYLDEPVSKGVPAPVTIQQLTSTGLAGRNITIGPSHGRFWNGSGWYWQRHDPCGFGEAVLEDTNSIRLMQFLHQYLIQDGATVHVPRELNESTCCHSATGLHWWKMAARYWLQNQGIPSWVWDSSTTDLNDDIRARPLYADYRGSDIYISHHTNAGGGGTATGTETFRDSAMSNQQHVANSLALATQVQNNIVSAIRDMFDPGWVSRGVKDSNGAFGEIRIPNRPACLVELAFHDNCSKDAMHLTNNFFRSVAMWGIYKGVCQYFGTTPTWDKYSYEYVSDTIPANMSAGQPYNVSVTFRNRGVVWSNAYNFRLGAVNDSDPFTAFNRVNISGEVRPGQTYTFNFTMTAPQAGTYVSEWRMVRDGVAWFGPILSKTIQVTGVIDTEPPTIPTGLIATATSPSSIHLVWNPSTDNVGVVGYQVRRGGAIIGTSVTNSYTDNSVQPNTPYSYEVRAYDARPNYSGWSTTAAATTPPDTEPPTVPTGLTANAVSPTLVELSWNASTDNVGVVAYEIERNDLIIGFSTTTQYEDATVDAGSSYTYRVRARDGVPNYSDWSNSVTISTPIAPVLVFYDGFDGNLDNWTQTVQGFTYSTAQNHGMFPGQGAAYCGAGESDQMHHAFTRPFAQGKVSGYFYDPNGGFRSGVCGSGYRQSLSLRAMDGTASMIIDNCMASNVALGSYFYRIIGQPTTAYTAYATRNPNTDCSGDWIYFETTITPNTQGASPTGTITFVVTDGAGTSTATTNLQNDFFNHGVGRITLGLGVSSAGESWWDDIAFEASPPAAPTMSSVANSTSQITWSFAATTSNVFGFDIADSVGNILTPAYPSSGWLRRSDTTWVESGLQPNTPYVRRVRGWNGTLNGPYSSNEVRWTLSVPPTSVNVVGSRTVGTPYGTPEFSFSAIGGFGLGKVQFYRYVWNQNASHSFTGTEGIWVGSDLQVNAASSGNWYLHIQGYNGQNIPNGSLALGPYVYTSPDPPGSVVVTDEGQFTPSLTTLRATWTAAIDSSGTGIAGYEYAIGTSQSTQDVRDWTWIGDTLSMTDSSLTLQEGETYFIQVRAKDNTDQTGDSGVSDGILAAPGVDRIGLAMQLQDSVPFSLRQKRVSAALPGWFWIQEMERSMGVRVQSGYSLGVGDLISVAGILGQWDTQRVLIGDVVELDAPADGYAGPVPVAMSQRSLGGSDFNALTPGITGGQSLYNIGLLVTVWGLVTHSDSSSPAETWFTIDDGSGLVDAGGYPGVRVLSGVVAPPVSGWIKVTGVVSSQPSPSGVKPVIIVRDASDIQPL